jgi:hypothetical protein
MFQQELVLSHDKTKQLKCFDLATI